MKTYTDSPEILKSLCDLLTKYLKMKANLQWSPFHEFEKEFQIVFEESRNLEVLPPFLPETTLNYSNFELMSCNYNSLAICCMGLIQTNDRKISMAV